MKKFLVFLVSVVVVASFGLVTYYFLRNDEVINFKVNEVYCNVGDIVTVNDLGKTVKKQSNKTTYNYNAGDETVTSAISYDSEKGYYLAKQGGDFELVISTSNKKFSQFTITVHIGDGSENNPYFIKNEQELSKIGGVYSLDAHYVLKSDILLSNDFSPIGFESSSNSWVGFKGTLNGENHTIIGTSYTFETTSNAGLFYSLNGATIKNLTIKNFSISGAFNKAGVLAGSASNVTISGVSVEGSSIINTQDGGITGGLVGSIDGSLASIITTAVKDINLGTGDSDISATIGGFAGILSQASVRACYVTGNINVSANAQSTTAGFVAQYKISATNGTIQQSYSAVESEYADFSGFINTISTIGDMTDAKYMRYLIGNSAVTGSHDAVKTKPELIKTIYDTTKGVYGVKSYNTVLDMESETKYVFYMLSTTEEYCWDQYVWKITPGSLPTLLRNDLIPSTVDSQYYISDNLKEYVSNVDGFMAFINECRSQDGKIKNKYYELTSDIDLSNVDWKMIDVENTIIDGKGYKITNLTLSESTNNLSFFGEVKASAIKNVVFENVKFSTDATSASVLATTICANSEGLATTIENVTVNFDEAITNNFTNFASLINNVKDSSVINNCQVNGLQVDSSANIQSISGFVGSVDAGARLEDNTVSVNLKGKSNIVGFANVNNGSVVNAVVTVIVNQTNFSSSAVQISGLISQNNGVVLDSTVNIDIKVNNLPANSYLSGAINTNEGSMSGVVVKGNGIYVQNLSADQVYVAGLAMSNLNKAIISDSRCEVEQLNAYLLGKNRVVAGLVYINTATIEKCISSANLYGNFVAGAVYRMNSATANVNQLVVGKYDIENKTLSSNIISGDKYVAGVAIDLRKGNVTNVQTSSEIVGKANDTVSSLIVLIFPNGASFKNATINSSFDGYGSFYTECWQDFRNSTDQAKKDLDYYTTGNSDRSFDLLDYDASAGCLQSVIINKTTASKNGKSYTSAQFISEGLFFGIWQWPSYEDTANSSFFRLVTDKEFKTASTYKTIVMSSKTGFFNLGSVEFSKNCAFDYDTIWTETANKGISLTFLQSI